jgi:hypothetical protein
VLVARAYQVAQEHHTADDADNADSSDRALKSTVYEHALVTRYMYGRRLDEGLRVGCPDVFGELFYIFSRAKRRCMELLLADRALEHADVLIGTLKKRFNCHRAILPQATTVSPLDCKLTHYQIVISFAFVRAIHGKNRTSESAWFTVIAGTATPQSQRDGS